MTKKARRRQIMEAVGYPDKRIFERNGPGFTYKRSGELLKVELRKILEYVGAWSDAYESQHKGAWRYHIRRAFDLEFDEGEKYGRFTHHELHKIWLEVNDGNE